MRLKTPSDHRLRQVSSGRIQIRRSLWVIVRLLIYHRQRSCDCLWGKWVISNTNAAPPLVTVEKLFDLDAAAFHLELNYRPQFQAYFLQRSGFCLSAAVTLTTAQETSPLLTHDLLWPWSGVTVSSRHPSEVTNLLAGRNSDVSALRMTRLTFSCISFLRLFSNRT